MEPVPKDVRTDADFQSYEKSRRMAERMRWRFAPGFPPSVIGALLLFLLLWLWDFPKPMCDDLFYSGSGLNLAAGGDLSNPLLIRQNFPGHLFLIYPPVHSFALAGWLRLVGISASGMTGFQMLNYFIISATTIFFFRQQNAPRWLEWCIPFGVACAFLPFGLRPEPLAAALIMSGFLLAQGWSSTFTIFPGFFLMALGVATAPRTAVFGASLMLAGLYYHRHRESQNCPHLKYRLMVAAGAILAAFFVFLLMIDFRLAEFFKAFHYYSRLVGGSKLDLIKVFFLRYVGVTQWAVFPLLAGLLVLSVRASSPPLKQIGILLAAMLVPIGFIGGLGNGTMWFVLVSVFALTAVAMRGAIPKYAKVAVCLLVTMMLLLANSKTFVNVAGILSGAIKSDNGVHYDEARAVRSTKEHPVLVDEFVARYVFNYRIPAGYIYWPFSAPFPAELATETKLLSEDVYLLGPLNVDKLNQLGLFNDPQPMWGLWQRRWSFYTHPSDVFIIRVKDLLDSQKATGNSRESL